MDMDEYHGQLITTITQLRGQVDVMDRFLSWFCPDYVRLKNLIEFQPHQPMTSVIPNPLQNIGHHAHPTIPNGTLKFVPYNTLGEQGILQPTYIADFGNVSNGRGRKRQTATTVPGPATSGTGGVQVKRRGRKRKHPQTETHETNENQPGSSGTSFMGSKNVKSPLTPISTNSLRTAVPTSVASSVSVMTTPKNFCQQKQTPNSSSTSPFGLKGLNLLATLTSAMRTQPHNENQDPSSSLASTPDRDALAHRHQPTQNMELSRSPAGVSQHQDLQNNHPQHPYLNDPANPAKTNHCFVEQRQEQNRITLNQNQTCLPIPMPPSGTPSEFVQL